MHKQRGIAMGWLYMIVLLLVIAAVSGLYYTIDKRGYTRGKLEIQTAWDAANEEERKKEAEQAAAASTQVEVKSEKAKIVYKTITQSVDKIIDRPVYRNVCLDADGLSNANAALVGQIPNTGKPDGALPAVKPVE